MAAPESKWNEKLSYLGYTKGEGVEHPTLYFKEGRYTQEHKDPDNVGWHPATEHCCRKNITKEAHDYYMSIRGGGDDAAKVRFKQEVIDDKHSAKIGEGFLFEIEPIGTKYASHPSRGRLITPDDPAFDAKYSAEYAKSLLTVNPLPKKK